MKSLLPRVVLVLVAILVVVFAVDYAWLRIRLARDSARAFDTVKVEVVDQIPLKGNKAEYVPEAPQAETCVRSVFPHFGDTPCWYLRRHAVQQVNF